MKYKRSKATGKLGVNYVERVVADHGSVFRQVHEEDDLGIDGFIELVANESASGELVAVQIKAGASYTDVSANEFVVGVDEQHLNYWLGSMVPVILVCVSPANDFAAWISVRDYVEKERYQARLPVRQIRIPFSRKFDVENLAAGIAQLAHTRAHERLLLRAADMCLNDDASVRHEGFQILSNHPDSRRLKITALLARRLLMDENTNTAKDALFILGYGAGRRRWSWNPNNRDEADVISCCSALCSDLDESEIMRLVALCDNEAFHGPQGLGERLFDVFACCFDTASAVLWRIIADRNAPIQRRANAFYLFHGCDDDSFEEACLRSRTDVQVRDLIEWLLPQTSPEPDGG